MKKSLYDLFQKAKPHSIDLNKVKIGTRLQTEIAGFRIVDQPKQINKPVKQVIEILSQQSPDDVNMVNRFQIIQPQKDNIQKQQDQKNNLKRSRTKSLEVQQIFYQNKDYKNKNVFKQFLRITELIDRQQIRPLELIKSDFQKIKNNSELNPQQCFQQIKALRQDLKAQHLHNHFVNQVLQFSILFSLRNKKIPYMFQCIKEHKQICKQLNIPVQAQYISYQIYYLILNDRLLELKTLIIDLKDQIIFNVQISKALEFYSLMAIKNYVKIYQRYSKSITNEKYIFEFYEQKLNRQHLQIMMKSINIQQTSRQNQTQNTPITLLINPNISQIIGKSN